MGFMASPTHGTSVQLGKQWGITARRYPVWLWRLPQAAAQVSAACSTCPQLGGYSTHCLSVNPLKGWVLEGSDAN